MSLTPPFVFHPDLSFDFERHLMKIIPEMHRAD